MEVFAEVADTGGTGDGGEALLQGPSENHLGGGRGGGGVRRWARCR